MTPSPLELFQKFTCLSSATHPYSHNPKIFFITSRHIPSFLQELSKAQVNSAILINVLHMYKCTLNALLYI